MHLQRLNMDNSWHLALQDVRILIDPWLEGTEVDFFPWFNTQWHRTPPVDYAEVPPYDLVLITQKYPDHFHRQTLARLKPRRLLVPASVAAEVRRILPDAEVHVLDRRNPVFAEGTLRVDWFPSTDPLGPDYQAFRISDGQESVFLAPHGYDLRKAATEARTPVNLLISTFNEFRLPFFLGGTVAPGVKGLMHLTETLQPRHIVATHDEDKHAKGLVIRLARVKRIGKSDLERHDIFRGRILDMEHYQPVSL